MNFIREVVETVYETESLDAKKKLHKISEEIRRYREQAKTYIDREYVDFIPNLTSNELLLAEGARLVREAEDLLQGIESETKRDLYSATEELQQFQEDLEEIVLGLRTTHKIIKIDDLFQALEDAKPAEDYLFQMDIISKLNSMINDPQDKILRKLNCYSSIKIKYHIESEMLMHNLKKRFEQLAQFNEKSFQNTKLVTMKLSKDDNQLQDILMALFNIKYNPFKICEFLMDNVFDPIIKKPVAIVDESCNDFEQLTLSYDLKNDVKNDFYRPNYKLVFKNICGVINFLGNMNILLSDSKNVLGIFGEYMKEKLLNLLINECLPYSIPETIDDMNSSTIIQDIVEFNNFLNESSFLTDDDKELLKYAENVCILFRNRFSKKILDKSVEIIHKDLHDMSPVSENNRSGADNLLLFPNCMVSKSTLELISHMDRILKEAQSKETDEETGNKLRSTITSIINQYIIEAPRYHEKLLKNIPQQTALFHNNSMYLAHWLTKNFNQGIELMDVLVKNLQALAMETFQMQVNLQKTQLMEILNNFDLTDVVSEISQEFQKLMRQCLRQLNLLKNVWQAILPNALYNKTMSNLLSCLCTEIIKRIMKVQDLPTTISNELVEIITLIEERAPEIFEDKQDVHTVKNWMKLLQLKMILGASLAQITDQWSEGKGPLTLNYKADEIKHLIRALFQNTDRRANALASII